MKFFFRSFGIFVVTLFPCLVFAGYSYQPLSPVNTPGGNLYNSNIFEYLKNIYTFAIAVAGGLAVIKIVYGGILYMLTDVVTNKAEAKKEIGAAVAGLLLALGSATLLYTINPGLLTLKFEMESTNPIVGDGTELLVSSGVMSADGKLAPLNSLSLGGTGGTKITAYGYEGDLTPDRNSSEARGNHNNLLTEGSVALSPDVIRRLNPQYGAAVYVGGNLVGYYDDSTAESYNGIPLTNRVDRYDPTGSLGGNLYSQSGGEITIDNTKIRKSIANP